MRVKTLEMIAMVTASITLILGMVLFRMSWKQEKEANWYLRLVAEAEKRVLMEKTNEVGEANAERGV